MTGAMDCKAIVAALSDPPMCESTERGLRVHTHCMYPSFTPVGVYVVRYGTGVTVHDGGGAAQEAWSHGRDQRVIGRALNHEASVHHLNLKEETLSLHIESEAWLGSAILTVANASAAAARAAMSASSQVSEEGLHEILWKLLAKFAGEKNVGTEYEMKGSSGKSHVFDFAVKNRSGLITLIDSVSPHHVSIASRYMAFSDTSGLVNKVGGRFIVHDKPLEHEDVALLTQFADVLPAKAMRPTFSKYFVNEARH